MTEHISGENGRTVSVRTIYRLHSDGCYSCAAVHKPFITKMNAHLTVQHWHSDCRDEIDMLAFAL